jgi:hypothetical protein
MGKYLLLSIDGIHDLLTGIAFSFFKNIQSKVIGVHRKYGKA